MYRRLIFASIFVAALALVSAPAHADGFPETGTLSLTGCGGGGSSGCPNATYSFIINPTGASLTINVTGTVNSQNDLITGVDLGFTPASNVSGLTLDSVTGNCNTVATCASWTTITSSLSNNGCGMSSNGAFICSSLATGLSIAQGGTYTWTWSYTLGNANNIQGTSDVHIGTNYGPHNGFIVSETGATGNSVPEPSSLMLLGSGLIGLAGFARRRFTA